MLSGAIALHDPDSLPPPGTETFLRRTSPKSLSINVINNYRRKLGSSGKSVGLWVELEPAAVEVDGGLEVFPVAVAAGGDPDRLDA